MFTFRIVENILTDASCTYDLILTDDETRDTVRFHAITETDANELRDKMHVALARHTVDLSQSVDR